jgi:hypothetical protein
MDSLELLRLCRQAFEAMPRSDSSRRLLRKIEAPSPPPYIKGNHALAEHMAELIREHLEGKSHA